MSDFNINGMHGLIKFGELADEQDLNKDLSYAQGKEKMITLYERYIKVGKTAYKVGDSVKIITPGNKKRGDYRVEVYGHSLTHKEMCLKIFSYITEGIVRCEEMCHMLDWIHDNGFERSERDNRLILELKRQIYWLTLQEDINYPIEDQKLGHMHPLFRYAEALVVAQGKPSLTKVYDNVDSKTPKGIQLFDTRGVIVPSYYKPV